MLSFNTPKNSAVILLLMVSCLLVLLFAPGGSDGASVTSAVAGKKESAISGNSETGSASLSNGDLGRLFQLLADNYRREVVSQEEDEARPSSMYLSMLKRGGNSDDYGHLRFGRSGSRIKYNDPDYGHMRFGK